MAATFDLLNDVGNAITKSMFYASGAGFQSVYLAFVNSIERNVYIKQPDEYERRKTHGGLLDPANLHVEMLDLQLSDTRLSVTFKYTNVTPPAIDTLWTGNEEKASTQWKNYVKLKNAEYQWMQSVPGGVGLAKLIEEGNPIHPPANGSESSWYNRPRPFIQPIKNNANVKKQIAAQVRNEVLKAVKGEHGIKGIFESEIAPHAEGMQLHFSF